MPWLPCEEYDNALDILLVVVKRQGLDSAKYKKIGKMRAHDFLLRFLIGYEIYSHLGHIFTVGIFYSPTYFVNAPRISK